MKKLLIIAGIVAFAATAFAAPSQLMKDGANNVVGIFAPNPTKNQALTVNRVQYDMSNDIMWNVYVGSACKFRNMSTSTRTGVLQTLPSGGFTRAVHRKFPFVSFSGCTSGELQRQ